jgi:folate-binding protein YgfZ
LAYNLPIDATPFFALPDHTVVALQGTDATAYAQAQFANDAAGLAAGHWQWNAWLTPKGRVIALFSLIKLAEDEIRLLLPDTDAGRFTEALQRLVFRRKLKIHTLDAARVSGAFAKPDSARNARIHVSAGTTELDYGDSTEPRVLRIADAEAHDNPAARARWSAYDLSHGLPRLPGGQREQWTPQQLSLERLHAFSVKKGCYPGQEIVARTHFLGKAKRGLALFESDAPLAAGIEVSDGQRMIGAVVSTAEGERPLALAVLPLEREAATLSADGIQLREIPLKDGLQR